MKTKFVPHRYFWMVLLALLAACMPAQPNETEVFNTAIFLAQTSVPLTQTALPTATPPPPTDTPTATVVVFLPTPPPTQPPVPILTPDAIQVERWKEYQAELAKALFAVRHNPEGGFDPEAYKTALCEWDILGRSGQEAHIWVACISADGLWLESLPAVIYLRNDGAIREVNIPNIEIDRHTQTETYDLHLFPMNIQEKLCLYYFYGYVPQCNSITSNYSPIYHLRPRESSLLSHLEYRKEHRDVPPLIILSAIPTATTTP